MNTPGFVAEAALYNSLISYGSSRNTQVGMGLNVVPQLSPNWPEVRCRSGNMDEAHIRLGTCSHSPIAG